MARQIQIRRGTATAHTNFIGAIGEITMDTTNKTLRVHDGTTAGGTILAKQSEIPEPYTMPNNYDFVIESQLPTAQNNYTWYRKYKSGWVEIGGSSTSKTVSLPVTMANTNYTCLINTLYNSSGSTMYNELGYLTSQTTTGFTKAGNANNFRWVVYGEYAQ